MSPKDFDKTRTTVKLSLTLSEEFGKEVREFATKKDLTLAELVKRSLKLMQTIDSADGELCLRDPNTGEITKLVIID